MKDKKDSFILKLESEPVRFMIAEKVRLTYHFLKRTEVEYNYLKQEWEKLRTYKEYKGVGEDDFS